MQGAWGGEAAECGLMLTAKGAWEVFAMDERERELARRNARLLWLFIFAFLWELLGRPIFGICFPGIELPPSLLRELLRLASGMEGICPI